MSGDGRLTLWIKGTGPVRIDVAKWPAIVEKNWSDSLSEYGFTIRKHQDGRMIISASAKVIFGGKTRVSVLVKKTDSAADDLLEKARAVADEARLPGESIQDLIAPLLAVDLD